MKGEPIHYSDAELAFVQVHCAMKRGALHTAFVREFGRTDVTADNIKQLCTRNGWTTGRVMAWRAEDDALLREIYHYRPTTEVAQRLGRSLISTYARAKYLGLKKSKAYLASSESGRLRPGERRSPATQFTKGHAPWTKGKKMPFNANSAATQFKKGSLGGRAAAVVKPIGFERIHKSGYLTRKIHNGRPMHSRWRFVHLIRWEELHGPIPAGMALKCLGDKLNTDPSNWELVARGVLPRLNGRSGRNYDRLPNELKPTVMAIAKLEHAVAEARR